jgi:hypothetical protein
VTGEAPLPHVKEEDLTVPSPVQKNQGLLTDGQTISLGDGASIDHQGTLGDLEPGVMPGVQVIFELLT